MKTLRSLTLFIGILVLAHGFVMTLDPHAVQVSAHDLDHEPIQAVVCTEGEAVSSGARVPLEPSVLLPLVSLGAGIVFVSGEVTGLAPEAPLLGGGNLRAFLQVFLN